MCFVRFKPWKRRPDISILVPFRDDGEERTRAWHWLHKYWRHALPKAEIIVGTDNEYPFSKAVAVNRAAKRARGKIFVIMDADCYMDSTVIQGCADSICAALKKDRHTWNVPYRNLYRLNRTTTDKLLATDPELPFDFPTPPPSNDIDNAGSEGYGHQFGALVLVVPRKAFKMVHGFDTRFRGWGGEDGAFMKSVDTMWGVHTITANETLHLWHRRPGDNFLTRAWVGQQGGNVNIRLAQRYGQASGDPGLMQALINERSLWLRIKSVVFDVIHRIFQSI